MNKTVIYINVTQYSLQETSTNMFSTKRIFKIFRDNNIQCKPTENYFTIPVCTDYGRSTPHSCSTAVSMIENSYSKYFENCFITGSVVLPALHSTRLSDTAMLNIPRPIGTCFNPFIT